MLYAAGDEFHQSFVKSRGSSVGDVMIDSGGILLTLFAVWVVTRKRRREKTQKRFERGFAPGGNWAPTHPPREKGGKKNSLNPPEGKKKKKKNPPPETIF